MSTQLASNRGCWEDQTGRANEATSEGKKFLLSLFLVSFIFGLLVATISMMPYGTP